MKLKVLHIDYYKMFLFFQIKRQKMIYHCKFGEFGVLEGQVLLSYVKKTVPLQFDSYRHSMLFRREV
jgi:hypothetical protein